MKIFIPYLLVIGFLLACSDETTHQKALTYKSFNKYLKKDMTYDDIVELFGEPDDSFGSGILTMIYELDDATEVEIKYTGEISSARHFDKDQNLLHTIIP